MTTMRAERFHSPNDRVPRFALFVMLTEDGTHTGVLCRTKAGVIVQDLRWHEAFRSQRYNESLHFVQPALEEEEVNDVTGMCRLIHDRQNSKDPAQRYRIPFAFRYGNNVRFNRQNGEMMLGDGLGLTCSTFVLTLFESVNISLVNFDGWPHRPDDAARHQALLDKMKHGIPRHKTPPADPIHVARVEAELPCIRVRPEEVAATGMFNDLPTTFRDLEPAGNWIIDRLHHSEAKC